jgi:hypothetical protein
MLRLARQRARIEESIIMAPWGEGVHFFFFSNLRIYVINNSVSSQDEVLHHRMRWNALLPQC